MKTELLKKADALAVKHDLGRETTSLRVDDKEDVIVGINQVTKLEEGRLVRKDTYYFYGKRSDVKDVNAYVDATRAEATLKFANEWNYGGEVAEATPATTKKATTKKASTKKAATKKAATKAAPSEEVAEPKEEPNVKYAKANKDHAGLAREVIVSVLGTDWKTDKEKASVVKNLVAEINDKVEVTTAGGDLLGSFTDFCTDYLNEHYDADGLG